MAVRWSIPFLAITCLLASAQATFACNDDVLMLSQQSIALRLCDLGSTQRGDGTAILRVSEHLRYGHTSLDHQTIATVPEGSMAPQTIDDIDLATLGLLQHLHITVRLTPTGPQIIHAIALPGPRILR